MKKFFLCITVLVSLVLSVDVYSQDPTLTFNYPSNNQSDVMLFPTIRLTSNYKIDSSSITFNYPNKDSSIYDNEDLPTIMLLLKFATDSLPDL